VDFDPGKADLKGSAEMALDGMDGRSVVMGDVRF
jgi:hypothetical protein